MATSNTKKRRAYGLSSPLQGMAPEPIVSQRAPTSRDQAEIGTIWLDQPNQASYILTDVTAGVANWSTAPASGATNDAQMTIRRVKRLAGSFEVTLYNYGAAALNGNVSISFWIIG
jgi:hypothetical protein